MICPICGSSQVEVPMVDIGAGEIQCGPAWCENCQASQDENGRWLAADPEILVENDPQN